MSYFVTTLYTIFFIIMPAIMCAGCWWALWCDEVDGDDVPVRLCALVLPFYLVYMLSGG